MRMAKEENEFSVLIGGKAGFGIDKAGSVIAALLSRLGYRIYIYRDYPSLIRGGHTFSIIRAHPEKIAGHKNRVDFLLALNQETADLHRTRLHPSSVLIYDSSSVKAQGQGIPVGAIIQEEKVSEIMRNTCIIGAFSKAAGISWEITDQVLRETFHAEIDSNLKVARRGYDAAAQLKAIPALEREPLPMRTGNEAVGLGLVRGGLKAFIAYPMTPSSGILHFPASGADEFGLKVVHPENEISVMLMALGFAYAGKKAAVGTSGGGFCLMTEGVSSPGWQSCRWRLSWASAPGQARGFPRTPRKPN